MDRKAIKPGIVALVSVALATLPIHPGGAHTYTANSSISIDFGDGDFSGRVESSRKKCREGRSVKLYRVRRGADKLVGKTQTTANGRWSIDKPNARGRFYARVTKEEQGGYGHAHICRGDASQTIRVSEPE